MKISHSRFDHISFSRLIETKLGHGGIKELGSSIHITPKTISLWMNGKSKSGPSLKSWDRVKAFFAKRGVAIRREDFYVEEKPNIEDISEPITNTYQKGTGATNQKIDILFTSIKDSLDTAQTLFDQLKEEIGKSGKKRRLKP